MGQARVHPHSESPLRFHSLNPLAPSTAALLGTLGAMGAVSLVLIFLSIFLSTR